MDAYIETPGGCEFGGKVGSNRSGFSFDFGFFNFLPFAGSKLAGKDLYMRGLASDALNITAVFTTRQEP